MTRPTWKALVPTIIVVVAMTIGGNLFSRFLEYKRDKSAFVENCVKSSDFDKLDKRINTYCKCFADKFYSTYGQEEMLTIVKQMKENSLDKNIVQQFDNYRNTCLASAGLQA